MSHTTTSYDVYTVGSMCHTTGGMKLKRYTIYSLSHPELGHYIGYTSIGLKQRVAAHKSQAKRPNQTHPLYQAMHGSDLSEWSILPLSMAANLAAAKELERVHIENGKPLLNVKLYGGKIQSGFTWGGAKNKGKRASEETREWFSTFHSTRPRKRKYDRKKMIAMKNNGYNATEIAQAIGCDRALAHRVITGEYKN